MGCIVSAEPLVNKFKCIKTALGRKDHRADLLDDDDIPGKGQHMHAQTLCQGHIMFLFNNMTCQT